MGLAPAQELPRYSKVDLVESARAEALDLSAKCDQIIIEAFEQHFSPELKERFSVKLQAVGSYGRKSQVAGLSDADLILLCAEDPLESNDEALIRAFDVAHQAVAAEITPKLAKLGIQFEGKGIRTRIPEDLTNSCLEYLASQTSDGKLTRFKAFDQYAEGLMMALDARVLAGPTDVPTNVELEKFLDQPSFRKVVLETLDNLILNALGSQRTLSVGETNLKKNIGSACVYAEASIRMLELMGVGLCADIKQIQSELLDLQLVIAKLRLVHREVVKGAVSRKEVLPDNIDLMQVGHQQRFEELAPSVLKCRLEEPPLHLLYQTATRADLLVKKVLIWLKSEGQVDALLKPSFTDPEVFNFPGSVGERLRDQLFFQPEMWPELQQFSGLPDQYAYQRFTILEHSLRAVEVLDRLAGGRDEEEEFVKSFQQLSGEERKILYLAALMHDSGKLEECAKGISDPYYHAEVGALKASNLAQRIGLDMPAQRMVGQLVANHLFLKDVSKATLTRIHDGLLMELPEELRQHRFINLLTLLTYADGKSTNPENWNKFRSNYLWEAARSAHAEIDGRRPYSDLKVFLGDLFESHGLRLQAHTPQQAEELFSGLPVAFRTLPRETLCDFIQIYSQYQGGNTVSILPHSLPTDLLDSLFKADVLIVAPDRRYLASNIVDVLNNSGFSIQSADFFTNSAGIVFNRITIHHTADRTQDIKAVVQRLTKRLDQDALAIPKSTFVFAETPIVTMPLLRRMEDDTLSISIKGRDDYGLLLHILTSFNRVGLSLRSLTTAQEGRYVEDNFELTMDPDRRGRAISDSQRSSLLRAVATELTKKRLT